MGRRTYDKALELAAGGYPHKDKKSYVFTQTASGRKREKDQNVHFIANVIEFAKELIHSPGKDIWLVDGPRHNLNISKCRTTRRNYTINSSYHPW